MTDSVHGYQVHLHLTMISAAALSASCIYDMFFSTTASGIAVLVFTLVFVVSDALRNPKVHLLFFFPNYYFVGMLVSSVVIYSGAYLTESRLFGYPNGVMGMFSLFYLLCLSSFKLGHNTKILSYKYKLGRTFAPCLQSYVISGIAILILVLVAGATALYSTPVLMGVNRVQFFKSVPRIVSYLEPALFFFCFFAAYKCFVLRQTISGLALLMLAGFGIYFFLGEKFSGFIVAMMAVLTVYAASTKQIKISFTFMLLMCAVVLGLSALIIFVYGGGAGGFDQFFARIALQAQVGWIFFNGSITWIDGLYKDIDLTKMVEHIGYMFTPYDFYIRHYVQGGYKLTGFYPAALTLKYGWVAALLISFVSCYLLGTLANFIWSQLRKRQLLVSFLLYSAYTQLTRFLFAMNFPGLISGILTFCAVSIWFIVVLYPKRSGRQSFPAITQ